MLRKLSNDTFHHNRESIDEAHSIEYELVVSLRESAAGEVVTRFGMAIDEDSNSAME